MVGLAVFAVSACPLAPTSRTATALEQARSNVSALGEAGAFVVRLDTERARERPRGGGGPLARSSARWDRGVRGVPGTRIWRRASVEVVEWSKDVSAASWIVDRLHPFASDLGSIVPEGFEAYARVLHPAWREESDRRVKVRWSQLARTAGVTLQSTTRFEQLEVSAASHDAEEPLVGTLELEQLNVLVELLASFTTTAQSCWFGVWEGYGWMHGPPATVRLVAHPPGMSSAPPMPEWDLPDPPPPGPRMQIPGRALVLYSGPIEAATAFCDFPALQSPNLWWPHDRAWCVATEIDFRSTYLGAARGLIDRVLNDERLEALPAQLGDHFTD